MTGWRKVGITPAAGDSKHPGSSSVIYRVRLGLACQWEAPPLALEEAVSAPPRASSGDSAQPRTWPRLPPQAPPRSAPSAAPALPLRGPPHLPSGSRWAGFAAVAPQRGSLGAAPAPWPPGTAWSLVKPTARALPDPTGYGPPFPLPSCGCPCSFGAGAGPGQGGAPRFGQPARAADVPAGLPSPAAHAALAGFAGDSENSFCPSAASLHQSVRRAGGIASA